MPFINLYIHAVFTTKYRKRILEKEQRDRLFRHMKEHARYKNIIIDTIGGYTDHVHILLRLRATQPLCDVIQIIKGESSYWANKHRVLEVPLYWAKSYFGESIHHRAVASVREYILNQEEHHQKMGVDWEFELLNRRWEEISKEDSEIINGDL